MDMDAELDKPIALGAFPWEADCKDLLDAKAYAVRLRRFMLLATLRASGPGYSLTFDTFRAADAWAAANPQLAPAWAVVTEGFSE